MYVGICGSFVDFKGSFVLVYIFGNWFGFLYSMFLGFSGFKLLYRENVLFSG